MVRTLESVAGAGRVVFELDRFELVDDDQFELQGRWFGVRGRRFIRPSLTVMVDDHPIRLLADLEHKPWAAEDGRPWTAAFPCRFDPEEVREAELTVAPDITIELRTPQDTPGRRGKDERVQPTEAPATPTRAERSDVTSLRAELTDAQRRHQQLENQLGRAQAERAQKAARMDELLGKLSEAVQERERVQAARDQALADLHEQRRQNTDLTDQRDSALRERDAAQKEAESARRELDGALRARDEALRSSDAAATARDRALAQTDAAKTAQARAESQRNTAMAAQTRAEQQREAAEAVRDEARSERDRAIVAREESLREQDSIRQAIGQLNLEVAQRASRRGAAMVMHRAALEPAAFRTHPPILPRALAIILLMAVVVGLLIVLHV